MFFEVPVLEVTFFFFMTVLPYSLALPAPPPDVAPGRADASCAARWIAWRMRRYVAHRQMLPFIAASMSASVGFGLLARSADADMSWPAWQ